MQSTQNTPEPPIQLADAPEPKVPFYRNPFVLAFLLGALAITILPFIQNRFLKAPPPIAQVGPWTLTDQEGQPFGSEQLRGKVWIADFFFTRCPSVCPTLQNKMKGMQAGFFDVKDKIQFVSFTVDPEYDTASVLKASGEKIGADFNHWTFLTGNRADLQQLIVQKMHINMGERQPIKTDENGNVDLYEISHLQKLVLFDQNGDLRAIADIDDESIGNLINAARLLIQKGPNP